MISWLVYRAQGQLEATALVESERAAYLTAVKPQTPPPTATNPVDPPATPTVSPTLPADAEIRLLGPPAGSAFRHGDAISFYWQWPLPLPESHLLSLYLIAGEEERLVGRLEAPNAGLNYRLRALPEQITGLASSTVQWQVRLEVAGASLAVSESRLLTLIGDS